jgi:hypothetical protein
LTASDLTEPDMGYDLRITRAIDWTANRGVEISTPEWMAVVAADPELSVDPDNGPFAAKFGTNGWFDWFEGNVFTTDPDHATVKKMLGIAHQLSATVQGDNGEFYDSANQWTRGRTGSSPSGGGAR